MNKNCTKNTKVKKKKNSQILIETFFEQKENCSSGWCRISIGLKFYVGVAIVLRKPWQRVRFSCFSARNEQNGKMKYARRLAGTGK